MSSKAMSLKGRIRNYAKNNNIAAQVVLQNYMFERLLVRLAESSYKDKLVVKGGILVSAIVGLDTRSTMDLDTTLRNLSLSEQQIRNIFEELLSIKKDDGVIFCMKSVEPIREDDVYGGCRVRIDALYDTICTPLSIDISTGDIITPAPVEYEFCGILDDQTRIKLWGYNIETVLAEKLETILSRGIFTTRPRDFYDIYILGNTQKFDRSTLRDALQATAEHRGSSGQLTDISAILERINQNEGLISQWDKYRKRFAYAKDISYDQIMTVLKSLLDDYPE